MRVGVGRSVRLCFIRWMGLCSRAIGLTPTSCLKRLVFTQASNWLYKRFSPKRCCRPLETTGNAPCGREGTTKGGRSAPSSTVQAWTFSSIQMVCRRPPGLARATVQSSGETEAGSAGTQPAQGYPDQGAPRRPGLGRTAVFRGSLFSPWTPCHAS